MIKINLKQNEIIINGHSGYDDKGKDIVCASVSTIIQTTVNAILRFNKEAIDYTVKDGYMRIKIKEKNKETDILITNMISLLEELEKKYKQYIIINREV